MVFFFIYFLLSAGKGSQCSGKRPAPDIPEIPAVSGTVWSELGVYYASDACWWCEKIVVWSSNKRITPRLIYSLIIVPTTYDLSNTYSICIYVQCVPDITAHTVHKCTSVLCAHNITALPTFMGIFKHYNIYLLKKINEKRIENLFLIQICNCYCTFSISSFF